MSESAGNLAGSRVLVLGGTGVIGSRLVEWLARERAAEVTVLVRNFTNAVRIARYPVRMSGGDVLDEAALNTAMSGMDVVIDCTFPKSGSLRERCDAARQAAGNIARAALAQRVGRVVHLSTISVYGRPPDGILDETVARNARDPYGASKLAGEREMLRWHHEAGLPVVILQPTIVYGPFAGWTLGPLSQLQTGDFALVDGGRGLCNAVYLDDVVEAVLRASTATGIEGEVFLVSATEPVTWATYYAAYEAMLGFKATRALTGEAIRAVLKQCARHNRPGRRIVAELRANPGLRQAVLGLPLIAGTYRLAQRLTPPERMQQVKRQLLDMEQSVPARPVIYPNLGQLDVFEPRARVSIDKACRQLGYRPMFDLARGMALTSQWARWARLL